MLTEVNNARQVPGEPFRRWFSDDNSDLIVWYERDLRICGFQFSFDKGRNERAVTWSEDRGLRYQAVDDGDRSPEPFKMSPILTRDLAPDATVVITCFRSVNKGLPVSLVQFILDRLGQGTLADKDNSP